MNKKNHMETLGILSLSLLLTSAYSISGCLPEMLNSFSHYTRSEVEFLISVPAMAMVIMVALSPFISKRINERIVVSTGLIVIGVAGCIPCFFPWYPLVFASRIILGIGIGLVNTRAVSLIGERFSGNQKAKLMGIRGSMETLGQAVLTFLAGQLLVFGWNYAFFIYSTSFIVLLYYLAFVSREDKCVSPEDNAVSPKDRLKQTYRGKGCDWTKILPYAFLGGLMVSANCVVSLRIPSMIAEANLGTGSDGATILSISVLAGFLGGFVLGKLVEKLKQFTLPFSSLMAAIGMLLIAFASGMISVTFGTVIIGFFIAICISCCFNSVSENTPKEALNTANSAVLIGCNLGSSATPFFLQIISKWSNEISAGFLVYAVVLVFAGLVYLLSLAKIQHLLYH